MGGEAGGQEWGKSGILQCGQSQENKTPQDGWVTGSLRPWDPRKPQVSERKSGDLLRCYEALLVGGMSLVGGVCESGTAGVVPGKGPGSGRGAGMWKLSAHSYINSALTVYWLPDESGKECLAAPPRIKCLLGGVFDPVLAENACPAGRVQLLVRLWSVPNLSCRFRPGSCELVRICGLAS